MSPLISLGFDHIHFYVERVESWADWFQQIWGFQRRGQRWTAEAHSIWLSQGQVQLILSQPLGEAGSLHHYLQLHPQGVADVAIQIRDAAKASAYLKALQYQLYWQPGSTTITHFTLVPPSYPRAIPHFQHSLIERKTPLGRQDPILPGFEVFPQDPDPSDLHFTHIDHVVLNVPADSMLQTADWYQQTLGWSILYRYHIETPQSGLNSVVVGVPTYPPLQLAINEPIGTTSQIQEFIETNRGPGIQHIALHSSNIIKTVQALRQQGIPFISVPTTYYQTLSPGWMSRWPEIQWQELLVDSVDSVDSVDLVDSVDSVDSGHRAQLLIQTFTDPIFPEPTFFFEIIQRIQGATGFGEQNFQALFEAIERQQRRRQVLT